MSCSSFFGPRLIWIDTICIDQSNTAGKNLQVRVMQDIYAGGAHELICLGGTRTTSRYALSLVHELLRVDKIWGREYVIRHAAGFRLRRRSGLYLRAYVGALVDPMRHPWFSRW